MACASLHDSSSIGVQSVRLPQGHQRQDSEVPPPNPPPPPDPPAAHAATSSLEITTLHCCCTVGVCHGSSMPVGHGGASPSQWRSRSCSTAVPSPRKRTKDCVWSSHGPGSRVASSTPGWPEATSEPAHSTASGG